jgi:hypothetical protein
VPPLITSAALVDNSCTPGSPLPAPSSVQAGDGGTPVQVPPTKQASSIQDRPTPGSPIDGDGGVSSAQSLVNVSPSGGQTQSSLVDSADEDHQPPHGPARGPSVEEHGQGYVLNDRFRIRVDGLTNSMFSSGKDDAMVPQDPASWTSTRQAGNGGMPFQVPPNDHVSPVPDRPTSSPDGDGGISSAPNVPSGGQTHGSIGLGAADEDHPDPHSAA